MTNTVPSGGLSLFPSTSRPPSRTQQQQQGRTRAPTPQQAAVAGLDRAILPEQSQTHAIGEAVTTEARIDPRQATEASAATTTTTTTTTATVEAAPPPQRIDPPGRSDTAFSEAQTLVRNSSVRSRSSIAKMRLSTYDDGPAMDQDTMPPPLPTYTAPQQQQEQQPRQQDPPQRMRSIFPQYNPDVPLDQQNYYPTQTSPTRIPRSIISRPLYSPVSPLQTQFHTGPPSAPPQQIHPPPVDQQQQQQPSQTERRQATQAERIQAAMAERHHAAQLQQQQLQQLQQPQSQQQPQPVRASYYSTAATAAASSIARTATSEATAAAAAAATGAASLPWTTRGGGGPAVEPPMQPVASSTSELRSFWKVANGWRAAPSEGRVYCLRMECDKDAPVYRLLSASGQPFYRLRLDPTSMAAHVTLSRHDPARPFKERKDGGGGAGNSGSGNGSGSGSGSGSGAGTGRSTPDDTGSVLDPPGPGIATGAHPSSRFDGSKHWQEALATTLEAEARKHQPQDGLVALLYPTAATRIALDRPRDASTVAAAERECARLVWDDDSGHYFLVHPALALPFCVHVERSSTWSRTAYTLEHLESPQHLARLTRDATGAGWLEIDTAIAARIEAAYLVDVCAAALLLVAHQDREFAQLEAFAPPPSVGGGGAGGSLAGAVAAAAAASRASSDGRSLLLLNAVMGVGSRSGSRLSMASSGGGGSGGGGGGGGKAKSSKKNKEKNKTATTTRPSRLRYGSSSRSRMEEFELDLESQNSVDLSGKMEDIMYGGPTQGATSKNGKAKKGKKNKSKDDDKDHVPGCIRVLAFFFKCCFWVVAMCVRAILAIVSSLFRCLTGQKL